MTTFSLFYTTLDLLYQLNLCKFMFVFYTVVISLGGCVVNFLSGVVAAPPLLLQAFKFGKMAHTTQVSRLLAALEVPRRWFSHFYVSASLVVTVALCLMWSVCVSEASLPPWAATTLDVLTTPHRTPAVNATSAAVALCLLALQIYRRLYENLFVSVFSSGHMNILHYIVGHTFYLGAVTLLLSQAPGFTTPGKNLQEKYLMPEGGLFEVVSCPHMLAEVLLYIGLLVILGLGNDWLWVTLWVLSNQVQVALMNHKWYQDTFKNYPKHRHAIFPFVL